MIHVNSSWLKELSLVLDEDEYEGGPVVIVLDRVNLGDGRYLVNLESIGFLDDHQGITATS